jgi:hypothetical protein
MQFAQERYAFRVFFARIPVAGGNADDARRRYWAVPEAALLAALSVSTPASKTPLPLQSFHAVTRYV